VVGYGTGKDGATSRDCLPHPSGHRPSKRGSGLLGNGERACLDRPAQWFGRLAVNPAAVGLWPGERNGCRSRRLFVGHDRFGRHPAHRFQDGPRGTEDESTARIVNAIEDSSGRVFIETFDGIYLREAGAPATGLRRWVESRGFLGRVVQGLKPWMLAGGFQQGLRRLYIARRRGLVPGQQSAGALQDGAWTAPRSMDCRAAW